MVMYKIVFTKQALKDLDNLKKSGISATVRREMGRDIDGACGQLRRKHINEKEKM